jgi:hypothetical protein
MSFARREGRDGRIDYGITSLDEKERRMEELQKMLGRRGRRRQDGARWKMEDGGVTRPPATGP